MTRRLALALPLSIALHAALIATVLTVAPRFDAESAIFIDLTLDAPAAPPAVTIRGGDIGAPRRTRTASTSSRERPPGASAPAARAGQQSPGHASSASPELAGAEAPSPSATPEHPTAPAPVSPVPLVVSSPHAGAGATPADPPIASMSPPTSSVTESGVATKRSETTGGGTPLDGGGAGSGGGLAGGSGLRDSNGGGSAPGSGRSEGGRSDGVFAAVGGGDAPGSEYGPYLAGVRRRIAESLRYPPSARRRKLTGTVQLEIVIAASGAITGAEVVVSSSHALLDDAAVDTVKSLRPQPFPSNVRARTLRVRLPVVFTLE